MKIQSKHKQAIRKQLITAIEKCIADIGTKTEVAARLGMTKQSLNNHLSIKSMYVDNVETLKSILEKVTQWATEKRQKDNEDVTRLLEKVPN